MLEITNSVPLSEADENCEESSDGERVEIGGIKSEVGLEGNEKPTEIVKCDKPQEECRGVTTSIENTEVGSNVNNLNTSPSSSPRVKCSPRSLARTLSESQPEKPEQVIFFCNFTVL